MGWKATCCFKLTVCKSVIYLFISWLILSPVSFQFHALCCMLLWPCMHLWRKHGWCIVMVWCLDWCCLFYVHLPSVSCRVVLICAKRSLCAAFSVLPYGESYHIRYRAATVSQTTHFISCKAIHTWGPGKSAVLFCHSDSWTVKYGVPKMKWLN